MMEYSLFACSRMRCQGTRVLVAFSWVVAFVWCTIVRCDMGPDCSNQFNQLAPCVPFVAGDGVAPSEACCKALGDVKTKSPVCLCMLVSPSMSPATSPGASGINITLAYMLPSLCKLPADSSHCNDLLNNHKSSPESAPNSPPDTLTSAKGPDPQNITTRSSSTAVGSFITWSFSLGFNLFAILMCFIFCSYLM